LIEAAVQQQKKLLGDRPLSLNIEARLPVIRADVSRATDILVQLIDNANLYAPKEQPITITAERAGIS
jgi:K+-sensing histidine kinase KdpD